MNKNFNIIWNAARNMYVVASEFAQSNSRIKAQARAVGMASFLGVFSGPVLASYTPEVGAGDSVTGETLNTGDYQRVEAEGSASNTTIDGGRQEVSGQSSGVIITSDGVIFASNGGNITDITSNGGIVTVLNGGTATDITFTDGGAFYTNGSAVATNVVLAENTTFQSDTNATVSGVNGNGTAFSIANNAANNIILNSGQAQFFIYDGAIATDTTVNSGYLSIAGEVEGITANGGSIDIWDGAKVNDLELFSGARMYVSTDASVTGTHDEGGVFYITDNTAKNVWITGGGSLSVREDGTSIDTVLNGDRSFQAVFGIAKHTTINAGAISEVYKTGIAENSVINASGNELIRSGKSFNATINGGGQQIIFDGGIAENSTVNNGGMLRVCGGNGACADNYMPGAGTAINTTVDSGGALWLESENATLDGTTLIKTGGILNAASGVISNEGVLNYEVDSGVSRTEGNIIQGGGGLKKTGKGTLLLTGGSTYTGSTDVSDGTLWLSDSGVIGVPGSNTQTMTASPGDINVAAGATFGGSGVANTDVNNSGNIAMSQNGEVGNTLTINGNYTGDNGNLYLNTQLGDDNSLTDKLVITGDSAGSTTVYVRNAGGGRCANDKGY